VEMGSVFRKKVRNKQITLEDAEEMWVNFREFPGVEYIDQKSIIDRAWKISCFFDLPTLYDAVSLAVAEEISDKTMEICEIWTADERFVNSLRGKKDYVNLLKDL
jgi:predicted nucleic acid-binding protein